MGIEENRDAREEKISTIAGAGHGADQSLIQEGKKQVVVFQTHGQSFALDIQNVVEVQTIEQVTEVFNTPPFVVGVVNIRGDIIALLDIGLFFEMEPTQWEKGKKMVIAQHGKQDACFMADRMAGVQWIEQEKIDPPPPTLADVSSHWIDGVHQEDGDPLIILDIPAIFESDRIEEL